MKIDKHIYFQISLFLIAVIWGEHSWYFLLLTAAQLIFVPLTLNLFMEKDTWFSRIYPYIAYPAFLAIVLLQLIDQTKWDGWLAGIYLLFTIMVSFYGFTRFLQRGFAHLEEFSIDLGMMYLWIGGAWYFAHETNLDTGFSYIIRWLTGIHFHYASFLLLVFMGLLGRRIQSPLYKGICIIIFVSPIIVALGITFSRWLELVSVLFYIVGIYGLIYLSYQAMFASMVQRWLVRGSFAAVGISILFSFIYALGNVWGTYTITIDFMLHFHGITNSLGFALLGLIGWFLDTPKSRFTGWNFPISRIRGGKRIGEEVLQQIVDPHQSNPKGLVNDLRIFEPDIDVDSLAPTVIDFYKNTNDYRIKAKILWSTWFYPFAYFYHVCSRRFKQLNLPLTSKQIEMIGNILPILEELDGRYRPIAWIRQIEEEVVFVALYSYHQKNERTFMNIALPLPGSAMIGILELQQIGNELQITSRGSDSYTDSGIYLAFKEFIWKLPLEERFRIREVESGRIEAHHQMWICGLPFLRIKYEIKRNEF